MPDSYDGTIAEDIVKLATRYTLCDWYAQESASPIPASQAKGACSHGPGGTRILRFSSQLMGVNIGNGHQRAANANRRQAKQLRYLSPFMATEVRGGDLGHCAPYTLLEARQ